MVQNVIPVFNIECFEGFASGEDTLTKKIRGILQGRANRNNLRYYYWIWVDCVKLIKEGEERDSLQSTLKVKRLDLISRYGNANDFQNLSILFVIIFNQLQRTLIIDTIDKSARFCNLCAA